MNDVVADVGSAPAPAEAPVAVIDTNAASHSQPITGTAPVEPKPEAPPAAEKPSPTVSEAIAKANEKAKAAQAAREAKVDAKPAEAKADAKPDAEKPAQTRGEAGRFAAKDVQGEPKPASEPQAATQQAPEQQNSPHREAPSRFTADAKTEWERAPESVKAETHRAIRELEQGYQKHRGDAEAFNEVREYDSLAKQHGTTLKAALTNYVGIEQMLARDPIGGLERVVSNMNFKGPDGRPITLRDIAAQIMGQSPDEQASRQNSTIQRLETHIAQLEQRLGGVTSHIEQQSARSTANEVEAFAKANPRFDELAEAIKEEIGHGYGLEEAYKRAERLNPAAAPSKPSSELPLTPAPAQKPPLNPAGSKSISGAPPSGSDPVLTNPSNQPVPTIEQALKKALQRAAAA